MTSLKFTVVPHPPYSPDLAPSDFWSFPNLKETLKGQHFFIGCRSWGGCAQMDQQQTRNFLHQGNGEMDRTSEEMYGHKRWLCWKISVQCGRELNFLHSDITVIILHGQILILYNWRPYLSITPRTCIKLEPRSPNISRSFIHINFNKDPIALSKI